MKEVHKILAPRLKAIKDKLCKDILIVVTEEQRVEKERLAELKAVERALTATEKEEEERKKAAEKAAEKELERGRKMQKKGRGRAEED
jgi:hypothetical protein